MAPPTSKVARSIEQLRGHASFSGCPDICCSAGAMADVRETTPLPLAVHRGLSDKLVEKRKGAALELERWVASARGGRNTVCVVLACVAFCKATG